MSIRVDIRTEWMLAIFYGQWDPIVHSQKPLKLSMWRGNCLISQAVS